MSEETRLARREILVGPLEFDRAESGEESLGATASVAGRLAPGEGQTRTLPVGSVGIEVVLDGKCGDP